MKSTILNALKFLVILAGTILTATPGIAGIYTSNRSSTTGLAISATTLAISPTTYDIPYYGQLGGGHISDLDFFTGTQCINGYESYVGAPSGVLSFSAVATREELRQKLKLSVNGSATSALFKFTASSEFASDTQSDSYSITTVFHHKYVLKNGAFNPTYPVLNGTGGSVIASPSTFVPTCGTDFVSQYELGGELYVAVRLNFKSIDSKSTFTASGSASALSNLGSFGGSLTTEAARYSDVVSITIFSYQIGGNPAEMGKILTNTAGDFPAMSCNTSNLAACQAAVSSTINYAANVMPAQITSPIPGTGPAVLGYAFRDYANAGVTVSLPPSVITPEILAARQALANELDRQKTDYNRAGQLISENGVEVHPQFIADVAAIQSATQANIFQLRTAGMSCFSDPVGCVNNKNIAFSSLRAYNPQSLLTGPRIPLHRYLYSVSISGRFGAINLADHFYTTNFAELGGGNLGYKYEGIQGYVLRYSPPTTTKLYRYYLGEPSRDHFYTTNWYELGAGSGGYRYEGVAAYVYPNQDPGTVPLYRYYNKETIDHFYTTSWAELGAGRIGYAYEGIAAYIYPSWY